MKVWRGYGSEHSMNLVMIGQFKSIDKAEKVKKTIDLLTNELTNTIEVGRPLNRYGDDVLDLLGEINCHILAPSELEQFLYEFTSKVEGERVILTTEESDVSAFIKLMVNEGAKIEIFSAHDYPDAEYGRGK
ncbi:MAG: DUF6375 family protein [Cyanobacteria bacterium]|nr:DUF6375 family protein [Cyanobacteriota bacterium]